MPGVHDTEVPLRRDRFDAVLFEMDGVVTETADGHAAAWKRTFDAILRLRFGDGFQPFDVDRDYRAYVDGRPRHDGIRSFLDSRGVALPFGNPGDPPDAMTICGVGSRKNGVFQGWLEAERVTTYPGAIDLIRTLKAAGLAVAVFSSSRNCAWVLENAGLLELFDARVDGTSLAELDIPGKPAPDMLLEAARRLGVAADRSVVVDCSQAGIEAGRAGGFGLVIGVDRSDEQSGEAQAEALKAHGADAVVRHVAALHLVADAPGA